MSSASRSTRRRVVASSIAATTAVGLGFSAISSAGAAPSATSRTSALTTSRGEPSGHTAAVRSDKGFYDVRAGATPTQSTRLLGDSVRADGRSSTHSLRSSLGRQAVVSMDGLTGTVRDVARLNGFLTFPSRASAATVAMGYVRSHLAALGLTRSDLATFSLRNQWTDVAGITHLSWVQSAGGVQLFGNGLQANVAKGGRLLNVMGSPVSGLSAPAVVAPRIAGPSAAIGAARADLSEPRMAEPNDTATPVLFQTPGGTRRAWETITMSASSPAVTVVDAANGAVLYRQPLSADAVSQEPVAAKPHRKVPSTGLAYRYFPGHRPFGGHQLSFNFTRRGWLPAGAHQLWGNNTRTYADVNDDNKANPGEIIRPIKPHSWAYKLKPFHLRGVSFCSHPYPCSWNPNKPFSWKVNRNQNATQVFWFVNNWHDHLMAPPIGFTPAAGNFQRVNPRGRGVGHDAVQAQTDDGANTNHGLPDGNHVDNANMSTPPDGHAPTMQMYLQHFPNTSYPVGDPFAPTNVGDEADTVYHEYTHGLSNRLVVDARGRSTLGGVQAGAMGEAWSDWYAMDYLVDQRLQRDTKTQGNIVLFQYDGQGVFLDRTEPIDCTVGSHARRCTGGSTGHRGGYTYADYGKVVGGPEVHGDGEIWAQTLWDLRARLGSRKTEALVTRAMSLSPANPSFLDERNAILLADQAIDGGARNFGIWKVFSHRGMGYFAGSLGGNDTAPGADFHMPPKSGGPIGGLQGTVTDAATHLPLKGVRVTIAFEGSPFVTNPSDVTDSSGHYSIGPVPVGRYPKVLVVPSLGYDGFAGAVRIKPGLGSHDFKLRRDWAARSGGAKITAFDGPDFGSCGPRAAIDQSPGTGWSTTVDLIGGKPSTASPKSMTVKLPKSITVTSIQVNPTANCGDGASASTGDYKVETSTTGLAGSWSPATGRFVAADRGHSSSIALPAQTTNVRYVRFTIVAPQVFNPANGYPANPCPGGGFSGCDFQDLTELAVYGS
ncbi:MAG: M36 family metallopeptidase [Nocardioidaceae bacterium]